MANTSDVAADAAVPSSADIERAAAFAREPFLLDGEGPEARFLRAAHGRACRYFRVAIGPEFNAAHWNHIHLDRGVFMGCR